MTDEPSRSETFSLLGGPLHRAGARLGLVKGGSNTLPLGLALGVIPWVILVTLAVAEGVAPELFSLAALGLHARLLVAIPLFFLAESWVEGQARAFVEVIVRSGVVPEKGRPALASIIARTTRLKDSWVAEGLLLLGAGLLPLVALDLNRFGEPAAIGLSQIPAGIGAVGQWLWIICLTLFRFLIGRWLWRIGLWSYFLRSLSKSELNLVPTHPDGVAGLGYLEVVQTQFAPLVAAISAVLAALLADGISSGATPMEAIAAILAWILLLDAILFIWPLTLFSPRLWRSQMAGWSDYTVVSSRYVADFGKKWLGPNASPGEPLLGTPDVRSLADLSRGMEIVRKMRLVPMSARLLITFLAAALLPLLPLVLLTYPVGDLISQLIKSLVGL